MSSVTEPSSTVATIVQVGGISQLKFSGKSSEWDVWKKRIVSHLRYHELYDVVEVSSDVPVKVGSDASFQSGLVPSDASVASMNEEDDVKEIGNTAANEAASKAGASASAAAAAASATVSDTISTSAAGAKKKPSKKSAGASEREVEKQKEAALVVAAKLQKKRDQAYHLLINCLPDALIREFGSMMVEGEPHGVWKLLLAKFERKTNPTKHAMREKWTEMKMERHEDFATYYGRVGQLADRMRGAGISLVEEEIVHVVLHGLPPRFETIKQVLKTTQQDLVLEAVKQQIQDYEEDIMLKMAREDHREKHAHWVREELPSRENRAAYYNQARGNDQYERNNTANPSTGSAQGSSSGSTTRPDTLCHMCGKAGHVKFDCPCIPATAVKCSLCRVFGHVAGGTHCRGGRFQSSGYRGRGGAGGRGGYRGGRPAAYQDRAATNSTAMSANREDEWEVAGARRRGTRGKASEDSGDEAGYSSYYVARVKPIAPKVSFTVTDTDFPPMSPATGTPVTVTSTSANHKIENQWDKPPVIKVTTFVVDSGSTDTITNNLQVMSNVKQMPSPITVRCADDNVMTMNACGDVHLHRPAGGDGVSRVLVKDVLYNPQLPVSLLSVSQLTAAGGVVTFDDRWCTIRRGHGGTLMAKIPKMNNLYTWNTATHDVQADAHARTSHRNKQAQAFNLESQSSAASRSVPVPAIVVNAAGGDAVPVPSTGGSTLSPSLLLHGRLGHPSHDSMKRVLHHECLRGVDTTIDRLSKDLKQVLECAGCEIGKSTRSAFGKATDPSLRATAIMDCWHSDLAGPIGMLEDGEEVLRSHLKYTCIVVDEYSHKVWGRLMASKDEAADWLMELHKRLTVSSGKPLKRFHSDGGGEYASDVLVNYFKQRGTFVTATTAHTPQRNGMSERMNRTLFDKSRTMLAHADLPATYWSFAFETAVYLSRFMTSRGSGDPTKCAEELWSGIKPSVRHLRTFGCDAYVHVPKPNRDGKLAPRAVRCIFVGYDEKKNNAYRCIDPVDGVMHVSRDVSFVEHRFTAAAYLKKLITESESGVSDAAAGQQVDVTVQEEFDAAVADAASGERGRGSRRVATHRLYRPWSEHQSESALIKQALKESIESQRMDQDRRRKLREQQQEALQPSPDDAQEEQKYPEPEAAAVPSNVPVPPLNKQSRKKEKSRVDADDEADVAPSAAAAAAAAAAPPSRPPPAAGSRRSSRAHADVDYRAALSAASIVREPRTYTEAMTNAESHEWRRAILAELESLHKNKTWSVVSRRQAIRRGKKPIGCRWIFKIKLNSDGSIQKYKARLVAKGYTQKKGIDFDEVFAPVMKYKTLRVLLCLAAVHDWNVKQMDVDTAFLNGIIDTEVYMEPPEGLEMHDPQAQPQDERGGEDLYHAAAGGVGAVLLLHKALYGTKQASRMWHQRIDSTLRSLGFHPCVSDPCCYVKIIGESEGMRIAHDRSIRRIRCMYLCLFVDDLIIFYSDEDELLWHQVKRQLMKSYAMKDLGNAEWVLGMKISRNRKEKVLQLDQSQYIDKMLSEFDMSDSKACTTPEECNQRLTRQDSPQTEAQQADMARKPYMELVGSLLYASVSTRPDIAHAVGVCTRFMNSPGEKHWQLAKRILRYLQGTKQHAITYQNNDQAMAQHHTQPASRSTSASDPTAALNADEDEYEVTVPAHVPAYMSASLAVFSDSDWAGDHDDRRSTSGCVVMLHGCPVVWLSKKQATVALSTAEAEYMAMSAAVQEVKWVHALLKELGCEVALPLNLFTDNKAAVSISSNENVPHTRTKHIDVRHHYVRELVRRGWLRVTWVRSEDQLADVFTKGLDTDTFRTLARHIIKQTQQEQRTTAHKQKQTASCSR